MNAMPRSLRLVEMYRVTGRDYIGVSGETPPVES